MRWSQQQMIPNLRAILEGSHNHGLPTSVSDHLRDRFMRCANYSGRLPCREEVQLCKSQYLTLFATSIAMWIALPSPPWCQKPGRSARLSRDGAGRRTSIKGNSLSLETTAISSDNRLQIIQLSSLDTFRFCATYGTQGLIA